MSKGLDAEFVRRAYQRMSDDEFIVKITQDAAGFTEEALSVVKNEIERRQLSPNLVKGLEAQHREYTNEELDVYCEIIRALPCPHTGLRDTKLNATLAAETMSFIVMTNHKQGIVVGSPKALDSINNASLMKTLLLGWWGFPWGPIRSLQSIRINLKSKKTNHAAGPNDFLRAFTRARIGEIEVYKNDRDKLFGIISGY